jgi:hypothetical protein
MRRREATNPEPAQGTARPELRGPGAEVLRLIDYPVVREVLADLGRRSRRPSQIGRGLEDQGLISPGEKEPEQVCKHVLRASERQCALT